MRTVSLAVPATLSILTALATAQTSSAPCYESAFGTLLGSADERVFAAVPLNAPFPAFGTTWNAVEVSSNGFVWLGALGNTDSGCCAGSGSGLATGAARIAAAWTDLVTDGVDGSGVYHNSLPGRDVFTWWKAYDSFDPTVRFTVQMQLTSVGEVTVWFHPLVALQHDAVCGVSPGGTTDPGSTDLSASFGLNTGPQPTLYEQWGVGTFDLAPRAIEFLPNGSGGWIVNDRPTCVFAGGQWTQFGAGCPLQSGIFGAAFYELSNGVSLDLSNREFELIPNGVGYTVQATSGSFFAGFTSPVSLQDDESLDQVLPFAFPTPNGGSTTIAGFCSNGFVWLDGFNNSPPAAPFVPALLADGPRICAFWTDLDPSAGGTFFDATATAAYFTWSNVPDTFNPTRRSTFQIQLFDDGRLKLCYQNMDLGPSRPWLAGFGTTGATHDPGSVDLVTAVPFTSGIGVLPVTLDSRGAPPVLGQPFPMVASNLRPSALLGLVVLGVSQFDPGVPLDFLGMTNCGLHASLDVSLPFLVTGFTTPIDVLTIYPDASFVGQSWFTQLVILDPGINPAELVTSNGGVMTLGYF